MTVLRVHVTGTVLLVSDDSGVERMVDEQSLPGRQGRLLVAMLAIEHRRPVSREELAGELWADDPPPSWDLAVRSLISKTRTAIARLGIDPISGSFGAYRWQMTPDTWLDFDEALAAIHRAESALRAGSSSVAAGDALVSAVITGHTFLPGIESPWIDRQRSRLVDVRIRALTVTGETWLHHGDHAEAARDAARILDLDPYREVAIRLAIRAYCEMGDRATAAHAYERFKQRLAEDLGVEPTSETADLWLDLASR